MNKEDTREFYRESLKGSKIDKDSRLFITLQKFLPKDKSASILDAACGNGRICAALKKMGYKNIYAVDLFEIIEVPGITYLQGSMDSLPEEWTGKFDFIICLSAIYHLEKPEKGISEFCRCLKAQGRIFFTAHTKYSLWPCWFKMDLLLGKSWVNNLKNVHFDRDVMEYLSMCNRAGFEVVFLDGIDFSLFYNLFWERAARKLERDYSVKIPTLSNYRVFPLLIRRLRARYGYHSLIVAQKNT